MCEDGQGLGQHWSIVCETQFDIVCSSKFVVIFSPSYLLLSLGAHVQARYMVVCLCLCLCRLLQLLKDQSSASKSPHVNMDYS